MIKSYSPLADAFRDWESKENGYVDDIWQTVEDCAKTEVQKQLKKSRRGYAPANNAEISINEESQIAFGMETSPLPSDLFNSHCS